MRRSGMAEAEEDAVSRLQGGSPGRLRCGRCRLNRRPGAEPNRAQEEAAVQHRQPCSSSRELTGRRRPSGRTCPAAPAGRWGCSPGPAGRQERKKQNQHEQDGNLGRGERAKREHGKGPSETGQEGATCAGSATGRRGACLARDVPRAVDHEPPHLAGLVPPLVAGVGAARGEGKQARRGGQGSERQPGTGGRWGSAGERHIGSLGSTASCKMAHWGGGVKGRRVLTAAPAGWTGRRR
jgi:hypothetical protein